MTSFGQFERAEGLKLLDLILSVFLLLKTNIRYKTSFAHNVMLCNSVTFQFWATLELFRRHGNHTPKRFDFCIECKLTDWTL